MAAAVDVKQYAGGERGTPTGQEVDSLGYLITGAYSTQRVGAFALLQELKDDGETLFLLTLLAVSLLI